LEFLLAHSDGKYARSYKSRLTYKNTDSRSGMSK